MASAEFQAAVARMRSRPLPDASLTPPEQREVYERDSVYTMPPGATATPVDADGVPCEWVIGAGADPARRLLYLHGGGYVLGNLNTHRDLAAIISEISGAAVLAVYYRLAPEHPYPAAVEDALVAYQFMRAHGPDGPGAAEASYVNGESAGGGLALATVLAARAAQTPLPDAVVAVSAWTDLALTGESYETRADVDLRISRAGSESTAALYLGGADPRDPLASPLYADLAGLPPLLLLVGDPEVLLDDTRRFTVRARAAGVDVTETVWPEMFHVWHHQWATLPEAREAVEQIGAFCRAHGPDGG